MLSSSAPIAQLVELSTFNRQVAGSSPAGGTKKRAPPEGEAEMNDYPVDPTGPLTIGTIDDESLNRLIAATICE